MKSGSVCNFVMLMCLPSLPLWGCKDSISVEQFDDSTIYVIERDHLSVFRDYDVTQSQVSWPVENFHETFVINTSEESISFAVESPLPDTLIHESNRSPAFGKFAFIPIEYSDFFEIPNVNNQLLTDRPDEISPNWYLWKDLKLGPTEGIHVPYSCHYGEEGMFIKEFGINSFLDMDII